MLESLAKIIQNSNICVVVPQFRVSTWRSQKNLCQTEKVMASINSSLDLSPILSDDEISAYRDEKKVKSR